MRRSISRKSTPKSAGSYFLRASQNYNNSNLIEVATRATGAGFNNRFSTPKKRIQTVVSKGNIDESRLMTKPRN